MKILIVGQGIAGTVLAETLSRRGVAVRVADAGFPRSASRTAAGIVNPVTGKRFVKSWRVDEFLPFARDFYQRAGADLGSPIWHERLIIRLLHSIQEENDWSARSGVDNYDDYLDFADDARGWSPFLRPGFRFGLLKQAAQVDFSGLIAGFREKWTRSGQFWQSKIGAEEALRLLADFDYIIWCEGVRGSANRWFQGLPWQAAKGEVLLLRFPGAPDIEVREMLKSKIMLAPAGEAGLFWAGSNYDWDFADDAPTESGKAFIVSELEKILAAPFEIVRHLAAIRPTVKDRRPLLGFSPENPRLGIFNGLGTKGGLLAPFWAAHFSEHILDGKALSEVVDCSLRVPLRLKN